MADKVLGTSSAMNKAATNFHNHVLDFDTSTRDLISAVHELQATWKGGGYDTFVGAMGSWQTDMHNVGQDLTNLSDAVSKSDAVFQSVDANITKAFKPFDHGGGATAGNTPQTGYHQPFKNF